jgi:hypothetical protein
MDLVMSCVLIAALWHAMNVQVLLQMGAYAGGRADIAAAMPLCPETPLNSRDDVIALRDYLASAW